MALYRSLNDRLLPLGIHPKTDWPLTARSRLRWRSEAVERLLAGLASPRWDDCEEREAPADVDRKPWLVLGTIKAPEFDSEGAFQPLN